MRRVGGLVAVVCLLAAPAAAGEKLEWSVEKLPGWDKLAVRMASHYRPVKADAQPAAPQYELPLDLSRLTNPDFATRLYPLRDKVVAAAARELLTRNGFAVVRAGSQTDVTAFYKVVQAQGVPIFVTSDSLLHLVRVQFGETLRDVEQRELAGDAALLSAGIQAEALKLYAASAGDIRQAARLLVGYATVPALLLGGRQDVSSAAAAALKEISSWPARPGWRQRDAFVKSYPDLLEVLRKDWGLPTQRYGLNVAAVRTALQRYLKAHPPPGEGEGGQAVPACVAEEVKAELALIAAHAGLGPSPLFGYKADYSRFVPPGHYSGTHQLRQYYKAMTWYGRMTFLLRGKVGSVEGLVGSAEAKRQTLAACLLAAMMDRKLDDARTLGQVWDRLYAVTAYYTGLADDLTCYDYRNALRIVVGTTVTPAALADDDNVFDLRTVLMRLRKPAIYSGAADQELLPVDVATEHDLARALLPTAGLRLMGQRYVPDSYVMSRLVHPAVGRFIGPGQPFTLVRGRGGPVRGFPRGLDVMAALGSPRARHWLKTLGDDRYARYGQALAELRKQLADIDPAGWNRNVHWSWLHALKPLLEEAPKGYPSFMQTDAWRDKQLSAALASLAQLRRDTAPHAKPPVAPKPIGLPPKPKRVRGYVEPVPRFYGRLLALTQMTRRGLEELKVLDDASRGRLRATEEVLARLLAIAQRELANEALTEDDYAFIRGFGGRLGGAVAGADARGLEATFVADVHADADSGQVLEEGTGYLNLIVAVYPTPDGGLAAGAGPILTHYEFKHPISDRLTDQAWRRMLSGARAPGLPPWAKTFTAAAAPRPVRSRQ